MIALLTILYTKYARTTSVFRDDKIVENLGDDIEPCISV